MNLAGLGIGSGESVVEFRVLGPFEVVAGGATLELGGPKQRAVLAVLAMRTNEVVQADTIIDALWGDGPPRSALAVVRTYVSRLRQAMSVTGDARLANRAAGYVLETDPEHVDAHRFEALVARGRSEAGAGALDVGSATLRHALALWRGDVLSGLPELAPLRPVATRLEEMRLAALEDRIDADLALGRHPDVVAELEALTGEYPFRERFWGQLIVALYRSGRQTDALAAYQKARSTLVDHVGVEPGPELRALERDVLAQADDLRWRPPTAHRDVGSADQRAEIPLPPAVGAASQQAFVGRARERDLVRDWFTRTPASQFSALLVAGPPGIGKTALAAHVARDAHAAGAVVVLGRADEGTGAPFQPLGEAISHWANHASADDLGRLGDSSTAALGRIVPALAERAPHARHVGSGTDRPPFDTPSFDTPSFDPPAPAESNGGADRQRLFEAIGHWIETMAARGPAVIVLEDLQWADPASLLAVRHLLRHPPGAAALLLATHRNMDIDAKHGLAPVLAAAGGQPHVGRIDLGGLADEDVAELVQSETGTDLDDAGRAFARRLGRETGGNPLFVVETVRHLTERGAIVPDTGRWPGDRPLAAVGVPAAVTELIEQRLGRLPPDTAGLLDPASVLGEHIDVPALSRVAGLSRIDVVDALEPALDAGLVVPTASALGRFRFSHALVRDAILHRLPVGRRARFHWEAGQALASLAASHPEPPLGDIAHHLTAGVDAGHAAAAIAANVRAGQQAIVLLAFEEAFNRFRTATELLETVGDTDDHLAYYAWIGVGQASGAVGESEPQSKAYRLAAGVARRRGWHDRLAEAAVGFATYNVVHGGASPDDDVAASQLTHEALAGLGDAPTVERSLLLALRAMRAVAFEQSAEARAFADSAHETADALGDDATATGAALLARAWSLLGSRDPHVLRETVDRALFLADRSRFRLVLRYLLVPVLAVPPLQLGDLADYESIRRRVGSHPEIRPDHAADNLATWDAAVAISAGRFAEVDRLAAAATRRYSIRPQVAEFQVSRAALDQGAYEDVSRSATDYASVAPTAVAPQAMLAWLGAEAGDHADAARWVETLRSQRPLDQLGWGAPLALRCLAEAAANLGDLDLAGDLLPVLTEYAGQMLVSYTAMTVEGAADRAIGVTLLTLGRHDEAVQRLDAALRLEESFRADALAARTMCWQARALLARAAPGDTDAARRMADRAAATAHRLGMPRLEADAAALSDQAR